MIKLKPEMYLIEDLEKVEKKPMRDGYGEALVKIGEENKELVVLCADLAESTKTDLFKKSFTERFLEMGISEQNMMGVAAGLAFSGMTPVVNSFACFSPGRNWEQMRVSVALSGTNVKVIGGHAGVGNGADGGNQQMFEDIALTRVLPGVTVLVPADYEQIKKATHAMIDMKGPVYMRMTKPARPVVTTGMTPFEIGKAQVLLSGEDVTVLCNGMMVYESLLAAAKLEGKRSVEVINVHTIKPFDKETILRSVEKTKKVIVAEEHSIIGGLASAIAELLSEELPTKMKRVGVKDHFGESGDPEQLTKKFGLTADAIMQAAIELG